MKPFKFLMCLIFLAAWPAAASVRNVGDAHLLVYNVIDASGNHVTGETVTLKVRRASDGHWFDFNDSTFKASGWTSKSANLSEDATEGFYYYLWTPPGSETAANQYSLCLDNASATWGDHQCVTVSYQAISDFDASGDTVTVGTNNDKTGYSLSQTFPANFADLSITAGTGRVTIGAVAGTSVSGPNDFKADVTNLDVAVSSRSSHSAGDVWSVGTRTITGGTVTTVSDKTGYSLTQLFPANFSDMAITATTGRVSVGTNFDKSDYRLSTQGLADFFTADSGEAFGDAVAGSVVKEIVDNAGGGGSLTVQEIVDGVWDEAISGHLDSGSMGAALNAAGAAGDPWSTTLPGVYGTGTAGNLLHMIGRYTDGEKTDGSYEGIEPLIRRHGR